jgi:hypothetical protein
VRRGDAVRREDFAGMPFLALRAEPAQVVWLGERPAALAPRDCVMYLGQADGTVVVFEPDADTVVRIPAGSVAIKTNPDAAKC